MLQRLAVLIIFVTAMHSALVLGLPQRAEEVCVRPVPIPAPPLLSEVDTLQKIQCHLDCISRQQIPVKMVNQGTAWSSYSFSSLPCGILHKVDECTLGCMTSHRNPALTVNRCRDECVTLCEDRTGTTTECENTCRRTSCRTGCAAYSSLSELQSESLPQPAAAPNLTSILSGSSTEKMFMVDVTQAMPTVPTSSSDSSTIPPPTHNISYLFRVQLSDSVHYIWQKDILEPLDLSPFACSQIDVSFAVVSQQGSSAYSPTTSISISGVGGWPTQVDQGSIRIQYTEDERQGFLGYSVANISWTKPQNHEYLTSYTIRILTETENCGGLNRVYAYTNISKDATYSVVSAPSLNGILMFGCSYSLSITAMPANQAGTIKDLTPDLAEPTPQISLECTRLWDEDGFINISMRWSLPSTSNLLAIRRFYALPALIDVRQAGIRGRLREYGSHRVSTEVGKTEYMLLLSNFSPQRVGHYQYEIQLRVERSSQYLWRRVPTMQFCRIDSQSEPPETVTDMRTINLEKEVPTESQLNLRFDLSWSPPAVANGVLTKYEVILSAEPEPNSILYQRTIPEGHLSAQVNATIPYNSSVHCLYVMMRSFNDFVPSDWSEPLTLQLDSQCITSNTTHKQANENGILLYYQKDGGEPVQVLEFSCNNTDNIESNTLSDRLEAMENKLNSVSEMLGEESAMESLTERLRALEQKLDILINMTSSHDSQK